MKFTIIRTDKKKAVHLTVKPAEWLMERIKTDTKAKDIGRLRRYVQYFGEKNLDGVAVEVARVCPSVVMAKAKNGRLDVVSFNGLVALHVGGLMKADEVAAVKEQAMTLPMTYAAFAGADGRSVVILVAVARKGGAQPQVETDMDALCQSAFDKALAAYGGILQRQLERQTVTARSSFLMTLDTTPLFNPDAVPLQVPMAGALGAPSDGNAAGEQREVDMNLYDDYELLYARAAEESHVATAGVGESQRYHAYLTELARRLCELELPQEEAFVHIRNHHVYKQIYDEQTLRAIVVAVYAENAEKPRRPQELVSQATQRLLDFLTTRYVFRYNTVMGYTEYRPNNTWIQDWQPCDETAINGLTIEARLANIDARDKDVRRYVRSNMIRQSNPIGDYLMKAYDCWDGTTDHIAMLARTVPCDLPQWELWFKKWFVSMVAQWVLPPQDYGNAIVPLLISAQGDGKTTFCRQLLPRELRWGFNDNLQVDEKRQTLQAMHNFLLINLDEFNAISPKLQEGFLKNVVQLASVKIKRPYGHHVEEFKRYASFIATTNETSVLSDATGSRRFICVKLTAPIDTSYKPNYEALYGQAYRLVMDRSLRWWFDAGEVKQIMAHNRQFQIVPPAIQYFHEHFEVTSSEADGQWLSPTAIYEQLRHRMGAGLKVGRVSVFGRYLQNIPGIMSRRVGDSRQYLVREKP